MIDKLKKLGAKYNLTTIQLAHFAGQLSHESFDFKITSENLNYSAERLLQVFPKYFNEKNVIIYARKPIKIANRVYANRMGNNDENSGEGWKFRGRGYIQLTGKNNYSAFSKFIGEDCVQNPDLVSQKYALESAIWFFFENKIFAICKDLSDESILEDRLQEITPNLFDSASLVITPNGVNTSKLYTIKPNDGTGDLSVTRNTSATRIDENGNIVDVSANVARIDYSTGSPAILVEPQRTNLLQRSEEFDNGNWRQDIGINTSGTPPRVNVEIATNGTLTADKLIENTTTGYHGQARSLAIPAGIHTVSIFVKPAERTFFFIGNGSSDHFAFFNLLNGTIVGTVGSTVSNPFITPLLNGWYRVGCTVTDTVSRTFAFFMSLDGVNKSYKGDNVSGLFIWGAQLEAGSNATSYIPTTTGSVTRNADVISKIGLSGITSITETFENGTTNVISGNPTSYTMSQGRIKQVIGL